MKYKLVVFDLDGTIIDIDSIWQTLHEFFGMEKHPERIEGKKRFMSGEINYQEWADADVELMKRHGADKEKINKALSDIKLINGSLETIRTLKKSGYRLSVISGSLDILLGRLIPDYKRIFDHVFINRIFFDSQGRIEKVKATPFEQYHKKTGLLKICDIDGADPKDVAFVGDNDNDVEIAKAAGFSIAFNSKSEKLNKTADVVIEKKDLREILKYL